MKTMKNLALIAMILFSSVTIINAQETSKHEFKTFYSTAYPGNLSDAFSFGLVEAIFGNEKMETSTFGMVGLGYRYQINHRFKLGMDLGFSPAKEQVFKKASDKTASKETSISRFLVIPTVEFSYWRNNWVNLYGSAGVGLMATRRTEKNNNNAKPTNVKEFAYQINPIGVRMGNKTIGGFVEAGYGYKGLITAGISLNF